MVLGKHMGIDTKLAISFGQQISDGIIIPISNNERNVNQDRVSMFVPMHDLRPLGGQKQGGAGLKSTILGFIIQYIFSFYTTICTPRNDSLFWRFWLKQPPCSSKSRLLSRHSKIRPCKSLIEMFLRTKFIGVWHQLFNLCAHDAPPERIAMRICPFYHDQKLKSY